MTDLSNSVPGPLVGLRHGRPIKFTPEKLEQIRNLVERGIDREEIARTLDVTVGSLQVTCSKAGISLKRRFKPDDGIRYISAPLQPESESAPTPAPEPAKPELDSPTVSIRLRYKNLERTTQLPFTADEITLLALEAEIRGMSLTQLIAAIITSIATNDLMRTVLDAPQP